MYLARRWFTGLGFDQEMPHHSTFSKKRHGRFHESKLFEQMFERIVAQCLEVGLVRGDKLSVTSISLLALIPIGTNNSKQREHLHTTSQTVGGQTNGATSTLTYTPSSPSTDQLQVMAPTTTSTNSSTSGSTVTGPSAQTVTTLAQQNPVIPSVPTTTSFTLPSFSPSASNSTNE